MPTRVSVKLPKPESWKELERITADLFRHHWNPDNVNRYAKQGQSENGVDILCEINQQQEEVRRGVQCKNTEELCINEVKAEVKDAEDFEPDLEEYWIMTTANLDNTTQQDILCLSDQRVSSGKFPV